MIEPATPVLQGEWFINYTSAVPIHLMWIKLYHSGRAYLAGGGRGGHCGYI